MAKVIVIGGGIAGLSAAYYLRQKSWDVTVLEKGDLSDNCSFGNMGYLSPSHLIPVAQPGMVEQGIMWMFDSKSPFYIRPELSLRLLRWGWKFVRHANERHVQRSVKPLAELLLFSRQCYIDWANDTPMRFELTKNGCISWFKTPKKRDSELATAELARQHGIEVEIIPDAARAAEIEPDLRPDVLGGVWYKTDAHLHPGQLMTQLPQYLEQIGVKIIKNTPVTGVEKDTGAIKAVFSGSEKYSADMFILAAGSWSPEVARLLGEEVLLMPAKGYSMDLPMAAPKLHVPCIYLEGKVALTPFQHSLRIGSTLEIGRINNQIMISRVQGILDGVLRCLPSMRQDPEFSTLADPKYLRAHLRERIWYGFRPLTPDGLPYIGFARHHRNLILATGHAMIGLSLGAGTGKMVAELASGEPLSVDISAFAPR